MRQAAKGMFWLAFAAITVLALLPGYAFPAPLLGPDKVEHALAFLVLTLLAASGWRQLPLWFISLAMMTYGLLIELIQGWPGLQRSPSFADVLADLVGIGLGLTLVAILGLRKS